MVKSVLQGAPAMPFFLLFLPVTPTFPRWLGARSGSRPLPSRWFHSPFGEPVRESSTSTAPDDARDEVLIGELQPGWRAACRSRKLVAQALAASRQGPRVHVTRRACRYKTCTASGAWLAARRDFLGRCARSLRGPSKPYASFLPCSTPGWSNAVDGRRARLRNTP